MRIFLFLILLLFLITAGNIYGEDSKCHRSTEGYDFWFGFMEGRNDNNNVHYIEITVTAREATSFKIYIGKSATPFYTGNVSANGSVQIKMPLNLAEATGSETIQQKGIHLVANEKPVNVYALNWDRNSADVAVIYPVGSLGTSHFAMCYTPHVDNRPAHGRNSEFLVVASEDSTVVGITPSVVTDNGKAAGVAFKVKLNKGEVYQVQSLNQRNLSGQGDLTGSYIESDKPVAVYSGSFSATVPAVPDNMGGFNHLYEQVPPIQTWGREYYTVPLLSRQADRYRVMASEDNTTILIENQGKILLNKGRFHEFLLNYNQPSRIAADKPILVAQFSQSNLTDENFTGGNGDPFMIILSSVSQTKNNVTFVAYNSTLIKDYYLNVVVLTSEKNNIVLDGVPVGFQFKPFKGSDYSYAQLKINSGAHTIKNTNPDRGFLAYVYGYGGYESYGYGVGFNLDLVLDLGQSINFQGDTLPICMGDKVVLDAGPYFDNYLWNTGDTTQKITVSKQAKYWATGTTVDGCLQSDSIFLYVSQIKKPNIGPDKQGCNPFPQQLNAGDGYAVYNWSTGELTQTIKVDKTNSYSVAVYDKYGCPARDTMNLTVFPVPAVNMIGDKLTCGKKTRKLELEYTGADPAMLANGKIIWKTDKPDKLTFKNSTNTSTDIEVTTWGEYNVSYVFTTPDGCETKNAHTLRFAEIPTSMIQFVEDPNDKCKGYSREIIYFGNASPKANYFWDYGNCLADSIDWNKRRVSVAAGNAKSVISLYVEEYGCWSDTSTLTMGANPAFVMNTAKSRGCDTATIQFSGELKIDDNLLFEWNFGDGSAINNLQTPKHFYSDTGKYDVTLKITNLDNQCFVGYTENEMVKIFQTPTAKIDLDPLFCNDSTVDAIYSFNIDSSFCYWKFEGAHQISIGNDSITAFLDKQIATIRLQVEEYGCKSKWAETTAKRKPFFDFSTDLTEGCQPLQVLAKATTADENIEFKWLTDSLITSGKEQNFILPDSGKYDFTLSSTSSLTGCIDTLVKQDLVLVHPKPVAQFEVDYPVAIIEHANLHFTNLTPDVDIFDWDFGDGFSSNEENPQHTFTTINKYPVELIVESDFGCIDTTMMEIEILPFNVYTPNAFRPDSDIPENREFMPVGVGVDPDVFQLLIFNRWGEIVFESNNPENKWDGTTKNSDPAPMGNYIWKAEFADIQGFQHSMKGQIMLIR